MPVSHFLTQSFIFPESKEEEMGELVSNIPTKGDERSREVDLKVVAYIVANTTSGWRSQKEISQTNRYPSPTFQKEWKSRRKRRT